MSQITPTNLFDWNKTLFYFSKNTKRNDPIIYNEWITHFKINQKKMSMHTLAKSRLLVQSSYGCVLSRLMATHWDPKWKKLRAQKVVKVSLTYFIINQWSKFFISSVFRKDPGGANLIMSKINNLCQYFIFLIPNKKFFFLLKTSLIKLCIIRFSALPT